MSNVVPELVRLAEDLSIVRDLGPLEADLVEWRDLYLEHLEGPGGPIAKWSDDQLVTQTLMDLAHLQGLIEACRRRGLLG